jgi:5-methylcytosine-specific restriction endonuclease McrA
MQTERYCACGCGRSLKGMRANALYFSTWCKQRAHRREPDPPEVIEWRAIISGDPCAYCGRTRETWKPTVGVDHIIPVSAGGANDVLNLTACCSLCNSSKQADSVLLFMLRRPWVYWT